MLERTLACSIYLNREHNGNCGQSYKLPAAGQYMGLGIWLTIFYRSDVFFCFCSFCLIGNNRRNVGDILSIYKSSIFRPRGNASKKMRTVCQGGGNRKKMPKKVNWRDAKETIPWNLDRASFAPKRKFSSVCLSSNLLTLPSATWSHSCLQSRELCLSASTLCGSWKPLAQELKVKVTFWFYKASLSYTGL